nr:ABC-2 family transporter protein [Variovorax boronicumulans]
MAAPPPRGPSAGRRVVSQFLVTGIEVVAIWALFDRFGSVQGWRIGEVALFYGLVHTMFALADALGRGFDILRTGHFDRLLLRPRPLALQLMAHDVRLSRFGRLLQALAVLGFASVTAPMDWTPATIALALFCVAGGVALFLGILVLQGTRAFWTVESLEIANVFACGGVEAGQYPMAVYARWFRRLLTFVVPLACVAYYPGLAILGRADPLGETDWLGWISPLAGFGFLALSFAAWRVGVRHYASTGN